MNSARNLIAVAVMAGSLAATAAWAETAPDDVKFEDGAVAMSVSGNAGDAKAGAGVFKNKKLGNCLACHAITKVEEMAKTKPQIEVTDLNGGKSKMPLGTHGHIGPALDGVAERYTEGELRMMVVNPKKNFPDTMMPAFHKNDGFTTVHPDCKGLAILSAGQVEDVVAFLKTLKE